MRLFILSLLAIGSVQSHAIGSTGADYAYRSGLLAYSPARGEFPVQSTLAKGYLRYIDGSGTQRLESYWYPEPLNGVRQYFAETKQPHRQQFLRLDSGDVSQAREEYFRTWCEQRYRDIQAEIDRLRNAGIAPPQDMVEQLQPLQKILSISNAATSETAEVQRAKEEHLAIWNEARLRALHTQQVKPLIVPSFQLKSDAVDAKETTQLKNEQFSQEEKVEKAEPVIRTEPQPIYQASQVRLSPSGVVVDTPEVMQAREEHFRLYNEAKLRAEKLGYESDRAKPVEAATKQVAENTISSSPNAQVRQPEQQVAAAPETPANVEHLKLVKQASISGQIEGYKHGSSIIEEHPLGIPLQQLAVGLRSVAGFDAPTEEQLRAIEKTPEVKRAREEHLKLKKAQEQAYSSQSNIEQAQQIGKADAAPATFGQEATLKAQQAFQFVKPLSVSSKPLSPTSQISIGLRTGAGSEQAVLNQLGQIEETPEVKRAREEHLRLVEEAKLRATQYLTQTVKSEGTKAVDFVPDGAVKLQQVEIQLNEESRLEAERIREEARLREEERLRDAQRLEEEQRNLEAELLKLRQEEEQRKEIERLTEEQRLKEEVMLLKAAEKSAEFEQKNQQNTAIIGQIRTDIQSTKALQGSFPHNPYLVQLASPSGVGTNFLIAEQQSTPQQAATVRYYFPAATTISKGIFNPSNPFLKNYSLEKRPEWLTEQVESAKVILPQAQPLVDERQIGSAQIAADSVGQQPQESSGEALSELERATREHFRAHEIALEQLRLAKLRNPDYKDCN